MSAHRKGKKSNLSKRSQRDEWQQRIQVFHPMEAGAICPDESVSLLRTSHLRNIMATTCDISEVTQIRPMEI